MDAKEFGALLADVETRLDRLKALYEQYFQGIERLEPTVARKEVDRRLYLLRRSQPRNTALRFRFQQLIQKYTTYQAYWGRTTRQIEEGTYRRDLMRARKRREAERQARIDRTLGFHELDLDAEGVEELSPEEYLASLDDDTGRVTAEMSSPPSIVPTPVPAAPVGKAPVSGKAPPAVPAGSKASTPLLRAPSAGAAPTPPPPPPRAPLQESPRSPSLGAAPPESRPRNPLRKPSLPQVSRPPVPSPTVSPAVPPAASTSARSSPYQSDVPGTTTVPVPGPATGELPVVPSMRPPPPVPTSSSRLVGRSTLEIRPSASNSRPAIERHASLSSEVEREGRSTVEMRRSLLPDAEGSEATHRRSRTGPARSDAGVSRPEARGDTRPDPKTDARSGTRPDSKLADDDMRQIYERYVQARAKNNERTDNVRFEAVARSLEEMLPKLQSKHAGKKIDFEVVVVNGRVGLKPVPK